MLIDRIRVASGHGLAVAGLAMLMALLLAPGARADAAQVTVVSPGGAQQTLALAALAGGEDVVNGTYVLRGSGGETSQTVTGFSLAALIEAAGADPYSFSFLEVQRPSGGAVQLSRHQALEQGAFAEGPAVVYATPTGTGFLRPSSGGDDLNGDDSFEAPQGVTVVLRKGTPLQVKAEASTEKTKPGKKVKFSAVVEKSGAGEELTFSWSFGDGKSASGAKVTHSFAKPGRYDVVVGVTSPGNEAGSSAVVSIQVGEPITGGPNRKGGGRNETEDAPEQGAASGPSTSGSGSGSTGIPLPSPVPSAPVMPTAPEPIPVPPPETPAPVQEVAPEPAGEEVSGELLTTPSPAELEQPNEPPAEARRGQLDEDSGGGGGLPPAAWGGLATLGLLGLGGLLEARGAAGLLPGRGRGGLA
jgi:hypothetical protein